MYILLQRSYRLDSNHHVNYVCDNLSITDSHGGLEGSLSVLYLYFKNFSQNKKLFFKE